MENLFYHGIMWIKVEEGDQIEREPIQLGDQEIEPGTIITKIGTRKRSSFDLDSGAAFVYVGKIDETILFRIHDGNEDTEWFIGFHHISIMTLIYGSGSGMKDVHVDQVFVDNEYPVFVYDTTDEDDTNGGCVDGRSA